MILRPRIQTSHATRSSSWGIRCRISPGLPLVASISPNTSSWRSTADDASHQPRGLVVMERTDHRRLGPAVSIDGNDVPTTTSRTQRRWPGDGETIILGGFIKSDNQVRRCPVLKDASWGTSSRVGPTRIRRPAVVPMGRDRVTDAGGGGGRGETGT